MIVLPSFVVLFQLSDYKLIKQLICVMSTKRRKELILIQ